MDSIGDLGQINMIDIIRRMAREAFGEDIPPELIAQLLPEMEAKMGSGLDPFGDDDDDDDLPPFFLPLPGRGKSSSKKRKPWFQL
jgi:hypothetical protein